MGVEAIKVYCTGKVKNNRGQVIEYQLINEQGTTAVFDKKHMQQLLIDGRYDVMNLQIDTLGRIVDKALPKEAETLARIKNKSKVSDKISIFEDAYNFITRNNGMVMILHHKDYDEMTEPFDRFKNVSNISILEKEFETYLLQKHSFKPTKIKITNASQNYVYIIWSTAYADVSLLDSENSFVKFDSVYNFNITCQFNSNTIDKYQKVATVYDESTGKIVENAFCGIVVYDRNNDEAVDYAQENIKKIEKAVKAISRTASNRNNSTAGITLAKSISNNSNSRVTLAKSNNVSPNKLNNIRKTFILFDLFKIFKK